MRYWLGILKSILLLCTFAMSSEASSDYRLYHQGVQRAERLMFMEGNFMEGLAIYDRTFQDFDFVFAGDCVIALQVALYMRHKAYSFAFTKKAIEQGVSLSFFK